MFTGSNPSILLNEWISSSLRRDKSPTIYWVCIFEHENLFFVTQASGLSQQELITWWDTGAGNSGRSPDRDKDTLTDGQTANLCSSNERQVLCIDKYVTNIYIHIHISRNSHKRRRNEEERWESSSNPLVCHSVTASSLHAPCQVQQCSHTPLKQQQHFRVRKR